MVSDTTCYATGTSVDTGAAGATGVESCDIVSQILQALEGRAVFYDLLASLYFKPLTLEQIENIATMDYSAYKDVNESFSDGFNDISRYLNKRHSGTRQELAVDFTSTFIGTSSWKGKYAVPYESVFTSEEGLLFQDSFHAICEVYRANNVARGEGYDYPDDHLSFMCEFMAIMSRRTIEALQEGNVVEALGQLETSQAFLQAHIRSWFDAFQDVALCLIETRFYRGMLKITRGFFELDTHVIKEISDELMMK
ncbi:MAG: molecular chaperone TorD family protein [Actinobacteria bacterium]|nr:molecular chaperone TorD family protein [Actinomycetota bacterium]